MNALLLSIENGNVRLTWSSPVLDDGSGPGRWRGSTMSRRRFLEIS